MAKTNGKERAVLVTTAHRGVFFGYAKDTSGDTIKLRAALDRRDARRGDWRRREVLLSQARDRGRMHLGRTIVSASVERGET